MMGHATEVSQGQRFEFGANWARFLEVLDDCRITQAEQSLHDMLGVSDLQGKRFLDIGSGSGLFSLAARRLGATLHSFDYDSQSVACTRELKQRYFPDDSQWEIEEGSVLDGGYLSRLGQFDVSIAGECFITPGRCGRRWLMWCPSSLQAENFLLPFTMSND